MKTIRLVTSVFSILLSLAIDSSVNGAKDDLIGSFTPCLAEENEAPAQDLPENCTMEKDTDWKFINICVDVTIVCEVEGVGTITIELDDAWCLF